MKKILCITASPRGEFSLSRQLTHQLARGLAERYEEGATITTRDLTQQTPPHWGAAQAHATFLPPEARTAADREALALSDGLCQELVDANVLVVGSPVWNFSVPSSLKAWVDHIVRPGVTFRYGRTGVEGLLTNLERVVIVEVSGGNYEDELMPAAGQYLQRVFRFLGVRTVDAISAQGSAIDEAASRKIGERALARFFARLFTPGAHESAEAALEEPVSHRSR